MTSGQIAKLFHREVDRFYRRYPRVLPCSLSIVDLPCSPGSPCGARDIAWCLRPGNRVYIVRRALRLPRANIIGILRHELGHLADPTPRKRGRERRADRIAEQVTGVPIRYDENAIQTVGKGTGRPSWLHR